MRHVDHQQGADFVGDGAEAGEIDDPWNGRAARDNQARFVLGGERRNLVVVDQCILTTHPILNGVEPFARLVGLGAMREMATGSQRHPQNGVARFDQRLEHPLIGLRPRTRLNVRETTAKKALRPVDREVLRNIDELASAVVALARIAFGIFVGEDGALGFKHRAADDVFRRDQFDLVLLPRQLVLDGIE